MSWTSCHVPYAPPPRSHSTSNSSTGISRPSPTLLAGSTRLNANSGEFVPRSRIVVKNADGLEVDLSAITKSVAGASLDSGSGLRQGNLSPTATPIRRPLSLRMQTEEQRRKRLADQEKKDKENSKLNRKRKRGSRSETKSRRDRTSAKIERNKKPPESLLRLCRILKSGLALLTPLTPRRLLHPLLTFVPPPALLKTLAVFRIQKAYRAPRPSSTLMPKMANSGSLRLLYMHNAHS